MKDLKIGVFGARRGLHIAQTFLLTNAKIVAVCDFNETRRDVVAKTLGSDVALYSDFDSFIEHDMDAVIVANYFHEHAPYAIKLLERGIHVFSECISNGTMADGVALARAAEKSNAIYMIAENYPFMIFNKHMKEIRDSGTLGKILYAEGEYNHPSDPNDTKFKKFFNYFLDHWRNYLPRTYYVTHSLAPIMRITGATPKRVCAMPCYAPIEGDVPTASHCGDRAAIIMTQNDDGSVFKFTGCSAFGGHGNSYRVCGTKGTVENLRGIDEKIMLRYNDWEKPEDAKEIELIDCVWNDPDEELIKQSGHGGGDYMVCREFIRCIKEGRQPSFPFDVHSAITMSSVAILAHRSMLEGGMPYDIPDLRDEEVRCKWEHDTLSPMVSSDGTRPTLPCCSNSEFAPTEEQVKLFKSRVIGEEV